MNTALFFLLTLAILIVVHEWGHYRMAVACGVKVLRFSIGFGKPLWLRQIGETEWVVGFLPLGGYVKMLDEREGPIDPREQHRAYNRQSLWRRSAIVAAGPVANLVLAVLLYAAAQWVGTDEPRARVGTPTADSLAERAGVQAGDQVLRLGVGSSSLKAVQSLTDLRWQLTRAALDGDDVQIEVQRLGGAGLNVLRLPLASLQATDSDPGLMRRIGLGAPFAEPVMGEIKAGGAAERAGLRAGDRVLSVDGQVVADGAALRARIRSAPQVEQLWRIERAGHSREVPVTPARADDQGQSIGRIEAVVGADVQMDRVRLDFVDGLVSGVTRTADMSWLTLKMFGRILIGQASLRNLSGPLTIAEFAGQSAKLGLAYYLGFLAVVSVSLGVLNLLPLPMLDGGHLLYHGIEGVTGRPIPDIWAERLQRAGLVVIALMMSIALYNDVARLLGLH